MTLATGIDDGEVRAFWEARGRRLGLVPWESLANLEEDPELLAEKIQFERQCILPLLPLDGAASLLDLGAGVGQWTIRFAPLVRRVVAVEYAETMSAAARAELRLRRLGNVEWIRQAVQQFETGERFDAIFVSGLLLYLNDADAQALVRRLPGWLKPSGIVLVRDGISVLPRRHVLAGRHSAALRERYSGLYRTAAEMTALFAAAGLGCARCGQVFPEGHRLNKHAETRLSYFVFRGNP